MSKLGFDINAYREDKRRRQERAEDIDIKHKANEIAADNVKIARKALRVSAVAAGISLIALVVVIVK